MSLAEVAEAAQVSRPAARRLLLTLEELGYVRSDAGFYCLAPRILTLGQAYLASLNLVDVAQSHMQQLAQSTGEAAALTTLDGDEIFFVARVGPKRIISSVLVVGSRLPAAPTSMGRVLLAQLPPAEREARLRQRPVEAHTDRTVTKVAELLRLLDLVERQGYSLVDQELEAGLRSVSAPVYDQTGQCVAALASSCHASRVSARALEREVLPAVLLAAQRISAALGLETSNAGDAQADRRRQPHERRVSDPRDALTAHPPPASGRS